MSENRLSVVAASDERVDFFVSEVRHSVTVAPTRKMVHQNSVLDWKLDRHIKWHRFLDICCGSLFRCQQQNKTDDIDLPELKKDVALDCHKIPLRNLVARLGSNTTTGLTEADVKERLYAHGLNQVQKPTSKPEWLKYCKHLVDGFCVMLWFGSFLCFIAYLLQLSQSNTAPSDNLYLGCVLATVVFITAAFSYYQEAKSSEIMASFRKHMPTYATVIRSGVKKVIPLEQLVVGDIIKLKCGDKIPADARITECSSFKVDLSCLTGESEPRPRSVLYTNENPLETKNLVFFSTFATEGTATAIVTAVGNATVMGKIARLASEVRPKETPLSKELQGFVYIIASFSLTLGILFLIIILAKDRSNWIGAVVFAIGIIIGNVPEGVIIEFALCLTLAAKRMAKRNALVKNLEAVETLGSTSVICSDKTGTLTQNRMTVAHLWFNNSIHTADLSRSQIFAKNYTNNGGKTGWNSLIRVIALNSRAEFKANPDHLPLMERQCIGDASEIALMKFAEISLESVETFRLKWPKEAEIPFTSERKFQASVHRRLETGNFIVVMKGAPERVIESCTSIRLNGDDVPISDALKQKLHSVYAELGAMGERVLGFAELELPVGRYNRNFEFLTEPEPNFPLIGFRFLGLVSMTDPPRPGVPEAVRKSRDAGIRVVMVTGDHPVTAKAVAKKVGIISSTSEGLESDGKSIVISGNELREMNANQLAKTILHFREIVFARTSPQQKLQIVEAFQLAGHIVAVTGDGVNDSPALKQADIGISMGIAGADLAKQAADMILLDDNFATIVFAIEEGRLLFDNLKKTLCYILVPNVPEIAAAVAYVVLEIPLPMSTIAMLAICLVTDVAPAVMLTFERAEMDIMKHKPRDSKKDKLVDQRVMSVAYGQNGIVEMLASFLAYFICLAENGFLMKDVLRNDFGAHWDSQAVNDLEDSYGQEWTYYQRKRLESTVNSVYFMSIVILQWFGIICCKTRRSAFIHHDWRNHYLFYGIVFETGFAVLLCYCPGVNTAFTMAPIRGFWWLPALPFGFFLIFADQLRKLVIRRGGSESFGERELLF